MRRADFFAELARRRRGSWISLARFRERVRTTLELSRKELDGTRPRREGAGVPQLNPRIFGWQPLGRPWPTLRWIGFFLRPPSPAVSSPPLLPLLPFIAISSYVRRPFHRPFSSSVQSHSRPRHAHPLSRLFRPHSGSASSPQPLTTSSALPSTSLHASSASCTPDSPCSDLITHQKGRLHVSSCPYRVTNVTSSSSPAAVSQQPWPLPLPPSQLRASPRGSATPPTTLVRPTLRASTFTPRTSKVRRTRRRPRAY